MQVPLVSLRAATLGAVRAGDLGIPSFMRDCKHPSGEGHTFLAQASDLGAISARPRRDLGAISA